MKLTAPVPGGPCWIELSTSDVPAAKSFYTALFGWRCETDPREEAGGYTMARLGDARVAALSPVYQPGQPPAWTVSFAAEDTDAVAEKAKAAGGTLLVGPMDVFEEGRFAVLADPSGAVFSLWQGRAFAGADLFNEPGALGWTELATRDRDTALTFYDDVFGWSVTPSDTYPQWGVDGADFGGLLAMEGNIPPEVPPHWLPYIAVSDVDATAATAQSGGGDLLMPPTDIAHGRRIAVVRDPQGAAFGIHRAGDEGQDPPR
ncbi:VOC family protein [Streptomyces sp. NBC_01257]|uniref:VOC family protein n=2 Tax=unclassified Streptomyces TaxID=2593676 RepID=UPI002DDA8CBC|nr:VOC family protein [Streptomyces sp. NBC_01257]WRZ68655.1 VOC family protein [Streptomyces sp. NBC_01257]